MGNLVRNPVMAEMWSSAGMLQAEALRTCRRIEDNGVNIVND